MIDKYKEIYNSYFYKKKNLESRKKEITECLDELREKSDIIDKAASLIQKVAQETQSNIVFHIGNIVDKALETVFQDEYKFNFNFVQKRGKVEAEYFLIRNDGTEVDIINGAGGGVIDIVSFALRIAVWTLSNNVQNVIVLDEPFRFLSQDLQERAGEILKELSDKLKLQFIIVTHNDKLMNYADKLFVIEKKGNYSYLIK